MPIEVAAALLFRGNKLLIAQRPAGSHLGGLWEFPGGKRETGETFEECLRRELQEELGIKAQVKELVETITHEYPEKTVCLKFFRCTLESGEPEKGGCMDFRWITREELEQFTFPEADARIVRRLRGIGKFWEMQA
jgi:mutator protein MutT